MQETQEMQIQSVAWENPLEEAMATHSRILAWEIPWMEESDWPQAKMLQRKEKKKKMLQSWTPLSRESTSWF